MQYKQYRYKSKPLFVTGLIFLLVFPFGVGGIVWLLTLSRPAILYSLAGIYLFDLLIIGWLFITAWDKSFIVTENSLAFHNKLFYREYKPKEIQEIMLLANEQDRKKTYYLDERYQPWERLLTDLEDFTRDFGIVSNLID